METAVYSHVRREPLNAQKEVKKHKKVFICSPFRPEGSTKEEQEKNLGRNIETARQACELAVKNGCLPLAPHLYFPQFLSDENIPERELGLRFGSEWLDECDELWVIGTKVTEGMKSEIILAEKKGIPLINHIFATEGIRWLFDMLFGSGVTGRDKELNDRYRQRRHVMHRNACRYTNEDHGVEEFDYTRYYNEDEEGLLYDEY